MLWLVAGALGCSSSRSRTVNATPTVSSTSATPTAAPTVTSTPTPTRIVYAWFPASFGNWTTSAIDWSAVTHICFRDVVLQPNGTLTEPVARASVTSFVNLAHANGVKVTVLVWGTTAANADQYLANYSGTAVQSLLSYVQQLNLDGINLDDETWHAANTVSAGSNVPLVTSFFSQLRTAFKAARADYHISWASPPVISPLETTYGESWPDYAGIAAQIDGFTVMGYTMNPPSIGWTTGAQPIQGGGLVQGHARDFATLINDYLTATGGTRDKLLLGVSNKRGGYEWPCAGNQPLSAISGAAAGLTLAQAQANAGMYGPLFDPLQQVGWYRYQIASQWHQGWYEDDTSLGNKLTWAKSLSLPGAAIWVIDGQNEPAGTWALLHAFRQ